MYVGTEVGFGGETTLRAQIILFSMLQFFHKQFIYLLHLPPILPTHVLGTYIIYKLTN